MKDVQQDRSAGPLELARRAAMLREAADALPPGRDRDVLLFELQVLEERLRTPAIILDAAE
jgi:hypothetical protein